MINFSLVIVLISSCNLYRFKIYAEGYAWSVSFKYIFACGSPVLVASPKYHEFFSRSLIPMVHYWPITQKGLCQSIKDAVNWGNNHPTEVMILFFIALPNSS